MSEEMGPPCCSCPERILRLLTPTDSERALGWRQKCWENIRARRAQPKLHDGMVIRFGSGAVELEFRVEDPRRLLFTGGGGCSRYQLQRWLLQKAWSVVAEG